MIKSRAMTTDNFWGYIRAEAQKLSETEPLLISLLDACILDASNLSEGLATLLSRKLADTTIDSEQYFDVIISVFNKNPSIVAMAQADILATLDRNPAATSALIPFLFFKGIHTLQIHRIAHAFWTSNRQGLALHLQSRNSELFGVDIHPAAKLGQGIMFDHATGIVIGETAVVGDDVSILHNVTLGGTGNETGDRHPKIGSGVLIGAGAKVLGNISVGDCARIAAGSVVLQPVEAHVTVAGVPARVVAKAGSDKPAMVMDQTLPKDCIVI
jgi:serine O-acetyltransferase